MKYAQLGEEVFARESELLPEEMLLYIKIVFHSLPDEAGVRVCTKTIRQLCEIYHLDPYNTYRRFKRLRIGRFSPKTKAKGVQIMPSPWLQVTPEGKIQPMVGFPGVKAEPFPPEGEEPAKTVVKVSDDRRPYIEKEPANKKRPARKSQFSAAEIKEYVRLCVKRGDRITNPPGLARALQDGRSDAEIMALLYPPEPEPEPEVPLLDDDGKQILDDKKRAEVLEVLIDLEVNGFNIDEFKHWYREDDWEWLITELSKTGVNSKTAVKT